MRNRVNIEIETRRSKQKEFEAQLEQKRRELDRLVAEHESLKAVELEQRALIERLSKGE